MPNRREIRPEPGAKDLQPETRGSRAQRIIALDFAKGALVLFMVFYHWVNYFIGPEWPYYRYLRFLTPSFIFITGFMISNVYLSKYRVTDPQLSRRLITRGVKLLIIFIVLNLARDFVHPLLFGGALVFNVLHAENAPVIFLTGYFNSKVVAFYILVPIGYLLVLSGILMIPERRYKYTFQVASAFVFLLLGLIEFSGIKNQNLEIIAIGMLGILAGFKPIETINRVIRRPYLLALAYLLYLIAITIWNVPYPLEVAGTCLSVMIIYLIGTVDWKMSTIQGVNVLLGKYSLFGYVSQIAILQILEAGLRHVGFRSAVQVTSFVAAFALTIISVEVLDRARKSSAGVDAVYKAVFN